MRWVLYLGLVGFLSGPLVAASRFEVSHLAIHRVERLVDLGKIDETYVTAFRALTLEVLPEPIQPGQAAFRFVIELHPNSDGTAKKLQLFADSDGKPIPNDFLELGGSPAENVPEWPDKTAAEVTEEALHTIEKLNKPEYAPFMSGVLGYSTKQIKASNGTLRAEVTMLATGTNGKLVTLVDEHGIPDGDPVVVPVE